MLRRGEAMAMHPEAIRKGPDGFFFMFGPSIAPNERIGDIAIVNIRGPLEQFADCYGENYESILGRVTDAMCDEETPKVCVLRLSSPGGVVAGLNETVRKLRTLSEKHGIPLVAYVDEMAASAAYALACACEDIYLPASGVVGSIGVISHMWSIARANDEDGVDVTVIASGDQKTDGNENLPISDDAVQREGARVDMLAGQFFRLVASSRPLSRDEVESYQAGIFIGKDGVKASLADDVLDWDSFIEMMTVAYGGSAMTYSGSDATHREDSMNQLKALINETRSALRTASGEKRKALQAKLSRLEASLADLSAYKKTKYVKEEETSEEDEAPEEESEEEESDEDAEGDEDDKDAEGDNDKKDAKKDAKKSKSRKSEDAEDAESEESDEDAESDEDDKDADSDASEEESMALLTSHLKGKAKESALGFLTAIAGKARAYDALQPTVAHLKATETARKRDGLIDAALKGRRITKAHAKMLRGKKLAFVKDFLSMHKKPLYFTDEEALTPGEGGPDAAASMKDVPEFIRNVIDASVQAQTSDPAKQKELRAEAIDRWRATQNGVTH